MTKSTSKEVLHCPSAHPNMEDSTILGVVTDMPEGTAIAYLDEPHPVTEKTLAIAEPLDPNEIFRFAAPCAKSKCAHFDGANCQLVERVIHNLPPVTEQLPPCHLRPKCVWFQQEGRAACIRCPQIITLTANPTDMMRHVATPEVNP